MAQMTFSTPAGRPGQLSIGLFQPSGLGGDAGTVYNQTQVPRVEAEATYKTGERQGVGQRHWSRTPRTGCGQPVL